MPLRVGLCCLTVVDVALTDAIGRVLVPTDVGRPSFPYSMPCSPHRFSIVPAGSSDALRL